jgi:hypothetical protein
MNIFHRIFEHAGDKVNRVLIPNANGHRIEAMEFNDSGRVLVRVDAGPVVTLPVNQWQEYVEKKTKVKP